MYIRNSIIIDWWVSVAERCYYYIGKELTQKGLVVSKGLNGPSLELPSLADGVYFLRIQGGTSVETEKILIGK